MRVFRYTIFLALAVAAAAHPLGNFSVNQYSGLEIGKAEIKLSQVLDQAEIPTFQNTSAIDTDKDGKIAETELAAYMDAMTPEYISRLSLSIDGVRLPLSVRSRKSEIKPGEGGLPIITFRWELTTV